MGCLISDLDSVDSVYPADMMELETATGKESHKVTIKQLSDHFKTLSNGAFKGAISKSLNDFDINSIGTWQWVAPSDNDLGPEGIKSGLLEVMATVSPDDLKKDASLEQMVGILQRISLGGFSYQRMWMYSTGWTAWGALRNSNGCHILYGESNESQVWFNEEHKPEFTARPAVTATAICEAQSPSMYYVTVTEVTTSYFKVMRLSAPIIEPTTVTTETTETHQTKDESTGTVMSNTVNKTVNIETAAVFSIDDTVSFNWIAVSDVTKAGDL